MAAERGRVPDFIGSGMSRNSFSGSLAALRDGKVAREQAVKQIERRYMELISIFEHGPANSEPSDKE
jgi:hypothetical protein